MQQTVKIVFFALFFLLLALNAENVFAATCGNTDCEYGENSCTCPEDCGKCEGLVSGETCKEYSCVGNICKITTIINCCGNEDCETGESFGNCPADCLPEKLDFEVLEPDLDKNFFRGESVLFKVKISAEGRKILAAETKLKGFFGELTLYNDGRHEDGNIFDAIYANRFFVDKTEEEGKRILHLSATFKETISSEQDYNFFIDPTLEVALNVKEKYVLGDLIDLNGIIKKKHYRFSIPLNIKAKKRGKEIFNLNTASDSNGLFFVQYHTSLIDPSGTWLITIDGVDSNNNRAFLQKEIELLKRGETLFLSIELLNELEKEYERGSSIEIIAGIKDVWGEIVEDASIKLIGPLNEEVQLLQLKPGEYSGIYQIPLDLPLGEQSFQLSATKSSPEGTFSGSGYFRFSVKKTKIIIEILEPSKKHYQIGDNLAPRIFLSYPNDEPVVNAIVKVLIQNKEFELNSVEPGIFSTNYFFGEQDRGRLRISFKAIDTFENEGFTEMTLEVSGMSLLYLIQKNFLLIAIVLIVASALALVTRSFLLKKITHKSLSKRKKELISLEKDLQRKYFEQNAIPKKDYETLMEKYESELQDIEKKIKELKKSAETKK